MDGFGVQGVDDVASLKPGFIANMRSDTMPEQGVYGAQREQMIMLQVVSTPSPGDRFSLQFVHHA